MLPYRTVDGRLVVAADVDDVDADGGGVRWVDGAAAVAGSDPESRRVAVGGTGAGWVPAGWRAAAVSEVSAQPAGNNRTATAHGSIHPTVLMIPSPHVVFAAMGFAKPTRNPV